MTRDPLRLLQISDCHLSARADIAYRGGNADGGLESLLGPAAAWVPQQVLATGDLSEDYSPAAYARLEGYCDRLSAPVQALPGNHDDDLVMRRHFPHGPWNGPFIGRAGGWNLVLLKSSVAGRIDGVISPKDLQFVDTWLLTTAERPVLIALHHQPVVVGSAWIDRHMLQDPAGLLDLVRRHERVRAVVWGHVHQAFEGQLGHTRLLGCPSTAVNSLPGAVKFTRDPAGPACRWLKLHADGSLETGLLYAA